MSKEPHIPLPPQRHAAVPFVWRARCSCGWKAIAPSALTAKEALAAHLETEIGLDLELSPDNDNPKKER
jgi:hypothetical protein